MSAEADDLLARLLREAAGSNSPAALREAAADGGHPDDELLAGLASGSLDAEKSRSLRRHILFCDSCTARVIVRGGEVVEPPSAADSTAQGSSSATPFGQLVVPSATRQRFGVLFGLAALLLILVAGFLVYRTTEAEGDLAEDDLTPTPVILDLRSIGPGGEGRRGIVRVEEPVVLDFTDHFGDQDQFIYVLLIDGAGQARLLEPEGGPAAARRVEGSTRLPGDGPGWDIGRRARAQVGDDLVFVVIVSAERIGSLEGEIAAKVAMPMISRELASLWPLSREGGVDDIVARIRALGFGGVIRAISARVRP